MKMKRMFVTVFAACSKAPVNDDSNLESDNSATIQDEASSENDFEYLEKEINKLDNNDNSKSYKSCTC